jgi:hypothetical protein
VDQTTNGKSVMVASVDLQAGGKGGWVALHADLNGKPGPVKYEVAVPAGASTNVTIPTPGGIPTSGYWPILHVDDHTVGTYEFRRSRGHHEGDHAIAQALHHPAAVPYPRRSAPGPRHLTDPLT